MTEEWKDIDGYEGIYQISNFGRVKSLYGWNGKKYINREKILYLTKFPKIGDKVAKQIILDLKGKVSSNVESNDIDDNDDVLLALSALGYKTADINKVLPKINKNNSVEEMIKEALRLMLK